MANEFRESKSNKQRRIKKKRCAILVVVFLSSCGVGAITGRITAPETIETVTVTKTVYVPSYEDELPEIEEIAYFDIPLSHSLQTYLYEICADEGVPVTFALAIIEHESQFNIEVVSGTDDYGLMQINKINHDKLAEEYQCADMLNPYQNVFCGIKIIGSLLKEYNNDYTKALMAYNMGQYGAEKAWSNGINSSNYTNGVLERWQYYEEVMKANDE